MISQLEYEKEVVKVLKEAIEKKDVSKELIKFIENSHKIRREREEKEKKDREIN